MADQTNIEWCDSTFNPWIGCTRVSPACDDCYAARSTPARTLGVRWGPGQPRRRTSSENWRKPRQWNAATFVQCDNCGWRGELAATGTAGACPSCSTVDRYTSARRRVFCASLADVFDNEVDPAWRADLFALIAATPNLDWLLLTKRIGNAKTMMADALHLVPTANRDGMIWPLPNVWLGATICNQEEADRDIPKLLATPAAVRFLSVEPMLGPVDITSHLWGRPTPCDDCPKDADCPCGYARRGAVFADPALHQIIVGGESGPKARPFDIAWARSLAKQCRDAGVAFHMKQLGAEPRGWCAGRVHADPGDDLDDDFCDFYEAHECGRPCPGRCAAMVHKKGGDMAEWPEDLRVREFPEVRS